MIELSTIDELKRLTAETDIKKINEIFETLIAEIQSYLGLHPVRKEVKLLISASAEPKAEELSEKEIFSAGVKRDLNSNSLILFKDHSKHFPQLSYERHIIAFYLIRYWQENTCK